MHITNGNENKARALLDNNNYEIRRSDALQLTCLGTAAGIMSLFGAFLLIAPAPDQQKVDKDDLKPVMVLFRLNFILAYIVAATGFCIKVFNAYNILKYLFKKKGNEFVGRHSAEGNFQIRIPGIKQDVGAIFSFFIN